MDIVSHNLDHLHIPVNRNSAEVKRATIVGNPMFSIAGDDNKTVASTGATPAELPGLDDLQLGMDYEQIMHYFENLKVDLD